MPEFPVQLNKIQPPPLRADTLARDRLLDWLAAKIHDRVVLVIAEAGYGKTTLLADFSRRTRLRTLWYRLDRGDRDWVGFIAHLAAAVRTQVPEFGPATAALLRETGAVPPTLDGVLDTFLRELGQLPADATALILDDFHLVDDSPEIRHITKEMLARAPERLAFVFASRRTPPVPLARLRALREVAELGTDDLRFDETETERLFRETYEMPLERGLITELSKRTEGWAASLQLVRAALHDRDAVQARAFIGSLSGAEGHLYDYLAEEVIGDLPPDLQDFLMRTSILDTIDLELGPVAAGVSAEETRRFLAEAERLGLLTRRGRQRGDAVRAHPLVREFLMARLAREYDALQLLALHRTVAAAAEHVDWLISARHYRAAGDAAAALRVVADSINEVLATGAYVAAHALLASDNEEGPAAAELILASRVALAEANPTLSLELAERALERDPSSAAAALTVIGARSWSGDLDGAVAAGRLLEESGDPRAAQLARAFRRVAEASLEGSITEALAEYDRLLATLNEGVHGHFIGVANLNIATLQFAAGAADEMLAAADRAIYHLSQSSAGIELVSARMMRATALGLLGRVAEWRAETEIAIGSVSAGQRSEALFEAAAIETFFGSQETARGRLDDAVKLLDLSTDNGQQALLVKAWWNLRCGDVRAAAADLSRIPPRRLRTSPAFEVQRLIATGLTATHEPGPESAIETLAEAHRLGQRQHASLWAAVAELTRGLLMGGPAAASAVHVTSDRRVALSLACESVLARLGDLDDLAWRTVRDESAFRPERWVPSLRRLVDTLDPSAIAGAKLLEEIGLPEDVGRLRTYARAIRDESGLGRHLARRVAPRVYVEDLGRVRIRVGAKWIEGAETRRKVLGLLCLLISKDRFAATREEVLDSLWPDLDPGSALNSLNQTVYFLRRVFEPGFREDLSPGYLRQDAETIWLDPELVDARSRECIALIREIAGGSRGPAIAELAAKYESPFALDFQYEEWASTYRDSLHVAYLRVVEEAIREDTALGRVASAIQLAERSARVEPDAEEIQLALVRLYRMAGAHAAAAEQYGHYARTLQALGVDAPAFDVVVSGHDPIGTPAY